MSNCIVCGGEIKKALYKEISRCAGCGHVFCDVNLTEKELEDIYARGYFFGNEYSNYVADRAVLEKNFKLRIKVLKQYLDPDRHKKLLEIGCAYGFFLEQAKGSFVSVKGIDISESAAAYAKENLALDVESGNFLKCDFGVQKFDCVCMWDTIEHLKRPDLYLEKINRLTDRGALIAITTGDIASINARVKKEKWRLIHPPTHIHYFSRKTLGRLLEKNGFKVIYTSHCGFYRSLDMILHGTIGKKPGFKALYSLVKRMAMGRVDFYLNLYDIMYLVAKKI